MRFRISKHQIKQTTFGQIYEPLPRLTHPVKVRELVGRDLESEGRADNEEEEEPGYDTAPCEDVVIYSPQCRL